MNEKLSRIFDRVPGALLEKGRFGRSESFAYWVNAGRMLDLCKVLSSDASFDWLENISCMQVENDLALTYFLRSSSSNETTILRVSLELPRESIATGSEGEPNGLVEMASVSEIWEAATPFESEISRFFGVRFSGKDFDRSWNGFPLRKDFIFQGSKGGLL
jgi:NADH:ubiquinone oxidoreductase subunit C